MMCCWLMHYVSLLLLCGGVADDVLLANALRAVVVVCGRVADDVLLADALRVVVVAVWQSCG